METRVPERGVEFQESGDISAEKMKKKKPIQYWRPYYGL